MNDQSLSRVYLDNAATSWPKPESVYRAVDDSLRRLGAPAGRSSYREAAEVERGIEDARRRIGRLMGAKDPRQIVFTFNGTDSLNLVLHGVLRHGDHVVTSVVEHNSTLRPLRFLADQGVIAVTYVPSSGEGLVDPDEIRRAIRPNTRLVALIHASNVTGTLQPVSDVGRIAAEHDALFLVDAAQSLGHVPIEVGEIGAHFVAAPGHKGLLGPLGTGVVYVDSDQQKRLRPLRQGGTGTQSEQDQQPDSLPDGYESGNHNVPGLLGLRAAVEYLEEQTVAAVRDHEAQLTTRLIERLREIPGVTIYGPTSPENRVGVVSFRLGEEDPQEVAAMLDAAHRIQVRSGLHCAPLIHRALGTASKGGTVRISVGPFNTPEDIDRAAEAVAQIAQMLL